MISRTIGWFRQADWLTADRVLAYARIFVVVVALVSLVWICLSKGLIDPAGHPIGTDFLNVYAAGLLVDQGHAAAAYDWPMHHAAEASVVAYDGYFGWHYPPMFLFLAAPLALLPYALALAVYLALTGTAYLAAVARFLPPMPGRYWLVAGFPAVFVNLGHGQNGFLTTALLATGLHSLSRRPIVAGLCLGCLAYKPQFALLLPVALLAGRQLRPLVTAGLAAGLLALASWLVFGSSVWAAFFASLEPTRTIILEQGATGWEKIVSIFSAVRMLGGGLGIAYALQSATTLAAMAVVALVWWRGGRRNLAVGCLVLAIPLTTPYVLDYDLVVLVVAVVALASDGIAHGFRPWEKITLAAVTLAPILARGVGSAWHMPIVPAILSVALIVFAARAVAIPLEAARGFAMVAE